MARFRIVCLQIILGGSLDGLRRPDEFFRRVAFTKSFEEELRPDHALLIHDERTRLGHAYRFAFRGLVANVVGVDRLALGVRQQRERDFRSFGKLLEHRRRIVADADDLDPGVFD